MEVLSGGEQPTDPHNQTKRIQMAVFGGLAGVVLGLGIVLLVGFSDRRLRHADDAQMRLNSTRMLGLLPTLPTDLTDPDQAALAAHAVHHIRTLLQIGGLDREGGHRIFAVTGPEAGSGKTSMTSALGLSFAASGSRTLLIDGDLVAGGLSRRFGNSSALGLLDACAGKELAQCISTTDIKNLSLLPVGAAPPQAAGTLSPDSLRRVIESAGRAYDVVLVDTGPVLGSLEASIAATAADSTILVCSRGDQKAIASKSLDHLVSLGAEIAGVVFNHALDEDMVRSSYATMSVAQSRRAGVADTTKPPDPQRTARFGPLASAVESYGVAGNSSSGNGSGNGENTPA